MALLQNAKGKAMLSRLEPFLQRINCSFIIKGSRAQFSAVTGQVDFSKWRKLDSRKLGIARSQISLSCWIVLKNLRRAGFEAYLVGGCVRDFLLNKVPKDFDVITTARLKQVKTKFHRSIIVGQRFPICRVLLKDSVVEVSSFETISEHSRRKQVCIPKFPLVCDQKDVTRWKDSMHRDFTINSLYYDPFANIIFDYTDAMMDLKSLKLRTVIPAHLSFREDQARILRGLRLAARLNLSFSKETEAAIYNFSSSVAGLSKSRLHLEMNYMLSYGAAEPSLLLLKRFKLLEILLPFHAAYLCGQADNLRGFRSSMLMKLFCNLDQLITCDRPCDDCLWVAVLAFHLTMFKNPQNVVVILTFASLFYHGTWEESLKFAKQQVPAAQICVPEISDDFEFPSDDEIAERVTEFAVQVEDSVNVLINTDCLLKEMTRFPKFPCSGLVFLSHKMGQRVKHVFNILVKDVKSLKAGKQDLEIDYKLLKAGDIHEIRFVLGKIIIDTLVSGAIEEVTNEKTDRIQVIDPPQKLEVLEQIRHTTMHLGTCDSMAKDGNMRSTSQSDYKLLLDDDSKARLSSYDIVVPGDKLNGQLKTAVTQQPNVITENKQALMGIESQGLSKKYQKLYGEGKDMLLQDYRLKDNEMLNRTCHLQESVESRSGQQKVTAMTQKTEDNEECKQSTEEHFKLKIQLHEDRIKQQTSAQVCESSVLCNHNLSPEKIDKDQHVKPKVQTAGTLLSNLFK